MTSDGYDRGDKRKLWGYRVLAVVSGPLALVWSGAVMLATMQAHGTAPGLYAYFACLAAAKAIDELLWKRRTEIHNLKMEAWQ